jgi:hypothetical protein
MKEGKDDARTSRGFGYDSILNSNPVVVGRTDVIRVPPLSFSLVRSYAIHSTRSTVDSRLVQDIISTRLTNEWLGQLLT